MIDKVYVLLHTKETKLGIDTKSIGTFSTLEIAIDEKRKREKVAGFIDYPNGFRIEIYYVDQDRCQDIIYLK